MKKVKLTVGQALVRFMDNQYVEFDGTETKFVEGVFGIFGHGNVVGLGEAIVEGSHNLIFRQGHSEQGMGHAAMGFAKEHNRRKIYAVTSSVGPGAANMVTAAATATVNRIPVLFLPGDTFACRQPDPVLQQVEQPIDFNITTNDAFKPVSRYWDRVSRPEQLMTAMINAMRVLTNPADTGAVTVALPQDVQGESYEYPESFFRRRVHHVERVALSEGALARAVEMITAAAKPMVVCGGGVRYSEAGEALASFCEQFEIPFGETQAGKGSITWDHPFNLGGIGVTGTEAANLVAADADLLIAVGSRLSDFTTSSKTAFKAENLRVLGLNVCAFDAYKMDAEPLVADARTALIQISSELALKGYRSSHGDRVAKVREAWTTEVDRIYAEVTDGLSQTRVLGELNENLLNPEDVVLSSSGSLPGDMQRLWRPKAPRSYHMEYGYSCMGYEVNAAFGAALAHTDRRVFSMVGDGSYVMLHSELVTAVQEGVKIYVMLFDNYGFQVIDNLQTNQGISSYGNEWRKRDPSTGKLTGDYLEIDFAAQAAAYGVTTYPIRTLDELRVAFFEAESVAGPVLFDMKVTQKSMTHGYESWWRVGVPEVSPSKTVLEARKDLDHHLGQVRQF